MKGITGDLTWRKIGLGVIGSLLIIPTVFACNNKGVPNLSEVKKELRAYHDRGAYMRDIKKVVSHAKRYLVNRINTAHVDGETKPLAIVFDIDETVLSNYDDMKALGFGGDYATVEKIILDGHAKAIAATKQLFQLARNNGIAIFFVTGRHAHAKASTIKNLKRQGFSGWAGIFFKPNHYQNKSVVPFKTHARQLIEKEGYDVVFSMGDQMSDLAGGAADTQFKLPNPYYYIP